MREPAREYLRLMARCNVASGEELREIQRRTAAMIPQITNEDFAEIQRAERSPVMPDGSEETLVVLT